MLFFMVKYRGGFGAIILFYFWNRHHIVNCVPKMLDAFTSRRGGLHSRLPAFGVWFPFSKDSIIKHPCSVCELRHTFFKIFLMWLSSKYVSWFKTKSVPSAKHNSIVAPSHDPSLQLALHTLMSATSWRSMRSASACKNSLGCANIVPLCWYVSIIG